MDLFLLFLHLLKEWASLVITSAFPKLILLKMGELDQTNTTSTLARCVDIYQKSPQGSTGILDIIDQNLEGIQFMEC